MTLRTSRHVPRPIWLRHRALVGRAVVTLLALVVASLLFALESRTMVAQGALRVWFFDVGQGDATLIMTPTGEQILIDGGPDRALLAKLGEVMLPWDRTLDAVVATHPDADHIGGLAAVLETYEVARAVYNGDTKDTDIAAAFDEAREHEPGAVTEMGRKGTVLAFGDVTLTELWPDASALRDEDANVASIVYRLDYGDTSVLLMGDAPESVEDRLRSVAGDIDVLRTGHHGSATSSSYRFVESVRPEVAVISCGIDNRYGHPHPVVLDRLSDAGARIWRTDLDGDVLLTSDGGEPFLRSAFLPF